MPTEAELEELVTEHIEKAVEGIEDLSRLHGGKGKGTGSDNRLHTASDSGVQEQH